MLNTSNTVSQIVAYCTPNTFYYKMPIGLREIGFSSCTTVIVKSYNLFTKIPFLIYNSTIVLFRVKQCLNVYTLYRAWCWWFSLVTENHLQALQLAGYTPHSPWWWFSATRPKCQYQAVYIEYLFRHGLILRIMIVLIIMTTKETSPRRYFYI